MIVDGGHIQTRIFEAWACVEAMCITLQMRAQWERKYRLSTWYASVGCKDDPGTSSWPRVLPQKTWLIP